MGISKLNFATEGLSGRVGNFVFRRRKTDGATMVARRPARFDGPLKNGQLAVQARFLKAVRYAKTCMADPDIKAAYKEAAKPGLSPYNTAMADFFNQPFIEAVDVTAYAGAIGNTIMVTAYDDFMVKEVLVSITRADGTIIENGTAVPADESTWLYTATKVNAAVAGCKVVVTVSDNPGNTVVKNTVLA